jgi:hypothetical protein
MTERLPIDTIVIGERHRDEAPLPPMCVGSAA